MKKMLVATASLALMAGSAAFADPAIVRSVNEDFPFVEHIQVPCANNGAGEYVDFDGYVHYVETTVRNGSRRTFILSSNPQGLTGIGSITGDVYHATGKETISITWDAIDKDPSEFTSVSRFHLVAAGTGNDFYVKMTNHVTINASGDLAVSHSFSETTCK